MEHRLQQLRTNADQRRQHHAQRWHAFVKQLEQPVIWDRIIPARATAALRSAMRFKIAEEVKHTARAQTLRRTQWWLDTEPDISITHHTGLLAHSTGQETVMTPEQERMAEVRAHQRDSQEHKQQEYERKMYERRRNTNR